jgi:hypothetical protein
MTNTKLTAERTPLMTSLVETIEETMQEIEYCHADMLTEHERNHPRGSGWARVYDKLARARDLLSPQAGRQRTLQPSACDPGTTQDAAALRQIADFWGSN